MRKQFNSGRSTLGMTELIDSVTVSARNDSADSYCKEIHLNTVLRCTSRRAAWCGPSRSRFSCSSFALSVLGHCQRFSDVRERIEALVLIEVELAGLVAERVSAEHLKQLAELLDRMDKSRKKPQELVQADVNFDLTIARAASKQKLAAE